MSTPPAETPEERRARKAKMKEENAQRLDAELQRDFLQPLADTMSFYDCQLEHTRLRQKVSEIQMMVIQGQLDVKRAQEFERVMVEQIHRVEERARDLQTGAHVPRPEK